MTDFVSKHRIPIGENPRLGSITTNESSPFKNKKQAEAFTETLNAKIRNLQYRLFVEREQSLLIVLQAPDAAGKDGLIRRVLGKMNPQGCRTYPFKAPTEEELSHDFLWRVHKCTPAKGMVSIFNRSHYEDVLVARVKKLVPRETWSRRFEIINRFEENLATSGTRILKFYLHISPKEQLERFAKRLEDPEKHWKLNLADYAARADWDDYVQAYEDVFRHCNSEPAPWFVIPADRKWYRNAAVASILHQTLQEMNPQLPNVDVDLDHVRQLYQSELTGLGGSPSSSDEPPV